jgi:hypothetical protein
MLHITSKLGLSAESTTTLQGVDKKVAVQSYKAENRCVSSKALYTDTHCVTALHSYTAIQRYIIQLYSAIHYTTSTQHPSDTCYLPPLQSVVCGELQDWISYLYLCKGYCLCATHVIQVSILQIPDSFANQQLSFTGGINCTGTNRVEPTQGKREEPSSPLARRGPTLIEGTSRKCPHA